MSQITSLTALSMSDYAYAMPPENNSDNSDPNTPIPSADSPTVTPDTYTPTVITPTQPVVPTTPLPSTPSEPEPITPEVTAPVQPISPIVSPPSQPVADIVAPAPSPDPFVSDSQTSPTSVNNPVGQPADSKPESGVAPAVVATDTLIASSKSPSDSNQAPPSQSPKKKRKLNLKAVVIALALIFFVGILAGAYTLGKRSVPKQETPTVTAKPITLPPEAIVTAECVPGRGKQYIIPKDIPIGPIYDVNNGRVIAIEYNLPIVELLSNPDTFSNTLNQLMKNYSTDHFTLVPSPPKPGEQVSEVHLIMFVVPKEEAATITCGLTPEQLTQLQAASQATPPAQEN